MSEYYGDVKGMPIETLESRLKAAIATKEDLEAEQARRAAFTSTEVLADRLHRLLHFQLDCDYHYSDWPNPRGCRAEFHGVARQIEQIEKFGNLPFDSAIDRTIQILEHARFGA